MKMIKLRGVADVNGDLVSDPVPSFPGEVRAVVVSGGGPMTSISLIETILGQSNYILDTAGTTEPVQYPHAQATDRGTGGIFLGDAVFPVPVVSFGGTVVLTSSGLTAGDVIKAVVLIDDK